MQKRHRFASELLGLDDGDSLDATLNNAGDARAQVITLALVLGAHETDLGVHTWRSSNAAAERYLSQISASSFPRSRSP
jgi:hypothetical protein